MLVGFASLWNSCVNFLTYDDWWYLLTILTIIFRVSGILTWYRRYPDQRGGSPRARLRHCTSAWLTLAIAPNVGDSGTQFMREGVCVRANP